MDTDLAVGWIGLGGAAIGAGAAILGGWLQHRQQAKTDRQKLIEERGQAAGREALTELYALRRHILLWNTGIDDDTRLSWHRDGRLIADQAEIAAGLIPKAPEVRTRLEEALTVTAACMRGNQEGYDLTTFHSRRALDHTIEILMAFMRGDKLPEPTGRVEDLRRHRAQYDLENPPELD